MIVYEKIHFTLSLRVDAHAVGIGSNDYLERACSAYRI